MKRWLGLAIALVVLAALAAVLSPAEEAEAILLQGTFVDDNQSPHQNGIEAVAAADITSGCNPPANDRFCPNSPMTRGQAATFLARAYNLPDDGNNYFVDDNGHTHEGGINRIAAAGITTGCNPPDNDRFCPDRSLTRAQFATFIVRAEDGLAPASQNFFTDDNDSVHENSINIIAEAGITVGCNPPSYTRFCPNRSLTRGQTATLLTRALSLPHNPQRIPLTSWNPVTCAKDGVTCDLRVDTFSGRTHFIEEGIFQALPYGPGEESQFLDSDTEFTLTLNGSPVSLHGTGVDESGNEASRLWNATLVFTEGSHTLVGEWRWNGTLIQRTRAIIDAD